MSATRFHSWAGAYANDCQLDDISSCPRKHPTQLTPDEIRTMRAMVTSPDYRHISTGTLAILAQRLGKIFASPSTWLRYVRDRGWRRPRRRVHPAKPTGGIRADKPDGLWHVDTTVIRLLDGPKVYARAVIDNFNEAVDKSKRGKRESRLTRP